MHVSMWSGENRVKCTRDSTSSTSIAKSLSNVGRESGDLVQHFRIVEYLQQHNTHREGEREGERGRERVCVCE